MFYPTCDLILLHLFELLWTYHILLICIDLWYLWFQATAKKFFVKLQPQQIKWARHTKKVLLKFILTCFQLFVFLCLCWAYMFLSNCNKLLFFIFYILFLPIGSTCIDSAINHIASLWLFAQNYYWIFI